MTDPHDPAGVARPQGRFQWLRHRAGRREYWAYVGALIVISIVPVLMLIYHIGFERRRWADSMFTESGSSDDDD